MKENSVNCPYCNQVISKFSVKIHIRSCVQNPEIQAALREWLPDPDYPGYIRIMIDYQRNTPAKPSREHVVSYYGSWAKVAAAFGLKLMDFDERRIVMKLAETGNELRRLTKELHAGRYSPSRSEYSIYGGHSGQNTGCIHVDNLVQRFGSWFGVLAHFGLTLPLKPATRPAHDDEVWLKHRATRVEQTVVLPPWSLKYGFREAEHAKINA